jgi:hypothetical protein
MMTNSAVPPARRSASSASAQSAIALPIAHHGATVAALYSQPDAADSRAVNAISNVSAVVSRKSARS